MEIVNIEAGTFGRMNAALEELVGKLQSERRIRNTGWKNGWTIRTYAGCWTSPLPN